MRDTPEATAAEPRTRTISWQDPRPYLERAIGMEPLEYLRAMLAGEIPSSPIGALMSIEGVEVEEGRIVFRAHPGEQHLNPIGLVHGGLVATLLDSALGCAVHSTLPRGGTYSTVQLNVNYVRPVSPDGGAIACEATVVHRGRTVATAQARVVDERGRLLAHGTTTCVVTLPPGAAA